MVLHEKLCGRVGRRPIKQKGPGLNPGAFAFSATLVPRAPFSAQLIRTVPRNFQFGWNTDEWVTPAGHSILSIARTSDALVIAYEF